MWLFTDAIVAVKGLLDRQQASGRAVAVHDKQLCSLNDSSSLRNSVFHYFIIFEVEVWRLVLNLQGSAKRWAPGCVNPASWLPLATGHEFTQRRAYLIAQPCRC